MELIPGGREAASRQGPTGSVHEAELSLPGGSLSAVLSGAFMERIAGAYWRFLARISLGLLRVRSDPGHQSLLVVASPLELLRFRTPVYRQGPGWAEVVWGIERGLLVSREGRGRGSLRIRIQELANRGEGARARLLMRMEVSGYYPRCRGRGWFAPVGAWLYARTQARLHRRVLRGFMRSLGRLEPIADGIAERQGGR